MTVPNQHGTLAAILSIILSESDAIFANSIVCQFGFDICETCEFIVKKVKLSVL